MKPLLNVRQAIPLLYQEGWTRHQEEVAKPPLTERTGWSRIEPLLKMHDGRHFKLKPRLAETGNRGNGKNHGRNSHRSRAHDRRTSRAAVCRITGGEPMIFRANG